MPVYFKNNVDPDSIIYLGHNVESVIDGNNREYWRMTRHPVLNLSASKVNLSGTSRSIDVTIEYDGDGTLTARSSNSSAATATVSGKTLHIYYTGPGNATITVNSAQTKKWYAASASLSVSCTFARGSVHTWAYTNNNYYSSLGIGWTIPAGDYTGIRIKIYTDYSAVSTFDDQLASWDTGWSPQNDSYWGAHNDGSISTERGTFYGRRSPRYATGFRVDEWNAPVGFRATEAGTNFLTKYFYCKIVIYVYAYINGKLYHDNGTEVLSWRQLGTGQRTQWDTWI